MAKKIVGEDGKVYKEKKPFYKKVWFWLVVVIIVIGAAASSGSDDNGGKKVASDNDKKSEETSKKEEKKDTFYKVGDSVEVGDAIYTLQSAELTSERNEFDDSKPKDVLKITYVVENKGEKDIPVGMDVEVYDSKDTKTETYPNDNTMGAVAPGKKMNVTAHFGLNEKGSTEIHFSPLVSFEKAAKFKVEVK